MITYSMLGRRHMEVDGMVAASGPCRSFAFLLLVWMSVLSWKWEEGG